MGWRRTVASRYPTLCKSAKGRAPRLVALWNGGLRQWLVAVGVLDPLVVFAEECEEVL